MSGAAAVVAAAVYLVHTERLYNEALDANPRDSELNGLGARYAAAADALEAAVDTFEAAPAAPASDETTRLRRALKIAQAALRRAAVGADGGQPFSGPAFAFALEQVRNAEAGE